MTISIRSALAALALAAAMALPATAHAEEWQWAYTTANVNLRAGPSVDYPRVTTVPYGARVRLYGCLPRWSWCDVAWHGVRGWMSGNYLRVSYDDRWYGVPEAGVIIGVPFIGFDIDNYWGSYYRGRPWYHHRRRWRRRPPPPPPVQPHRPRPRPDYFRPGSGSSPTRPTNRSGHPAPIFRGTPPAARTNGGAGRIAPRTPNAPLFRGTAPQAGGIRPRANPDPCPPGSACATGRRP